jgi:methyl-accepting chemotaxis protein
MSERLLIEMQVVDHATAPIKNVQDKLRGLDSQVKKSTSGLKTYQKATGLANVSTQKWAKGALQQAGYQIGDFAVQVANGTSKIQAFGQQAPQLLQIFGPFGAILGAAVAIVAAFGVVLEKSGKELTNFGSIFGQLREPLSGVVESLSAIKAAFGSVLPVIVDNIDTALIAAGIFGAYMGVKLVASMLAASASTGMMSVALATFRAALLASALSAGRYTVVMTTLRAVTLTLGAAVAGVGKILMRFLPIAVLLGVAKLIEMFLQLKKGAGGVGNAISLLKDVMLAFIDKQVENFKVIILQVKSAGNEIKAFFLGLTVVVSDYITSGMNKIIDGVNKVLAKIERPQIEPINLTDSLGLNEAMRATQDQIALIDAEIKRLSDENSPAAARLKEALEALFGAFAAGETVVQITGDKVKKVGKDIKYVYQSIRDTISNSMEDAFMSMVDGTKKPIEAFKSMASAIIKELFRILVVQRIVGSFGTGATAGTGILGALSTAFPGLNTIAGAKANGGTVSGGRPYLVGEKGPELMVPGRTGTVVPNDQLSGGGVTVNQTINISTGVAQTVRSEIRALMPQIADNAKAAVLDAKRRGGAYGGAFA